MTLLLKIAKPDEDPVEGRVFIVESAAVFERKVVQALTAPPLDTINVPDMELLLRATRAQQIEMGIALLRRWFGQDPDAQSVLTFLAEKEGLR